MHWLTAIIVLILVIIHFYTTRNQTKACIHKTNMRRLWADHVIYTRLYIIAAFANDQSKDTIAARLMSNQTKIGEYVSLAYPGKGDRLAELLRDHIQLFVDAITAIQNGQPVDTKKILENGRQISIYLQKVNPKWHIGEHMTDHINLTLKEVKLISSHDSINDIKNFDMIMESIYVMSDMLV